MPMTILSKNLIDRRTQLRMTQTEVAKQAGISRNYVSLLEMGTQSNPSVKVLDGLAIALNISPDELVKGTSPKGNYLPATLRDFALKEHLSFDTVWRLQGIPTPARMPTTIAGWRELWLIILPWIGTESPEEITTFYEQVFPIRMVP